MSFDIQNATSWLNPNGNFNPTGKWGSHSDWAFHNNKKMEELFGSGWMRVTFIGDTIYMSNDLSVLPTYKQKKSIVDLSIESNGRFKKAIYENGQGKETTLFSSYDFSESNKHMNFKEWLLTEDSVMGININDSKSPFTTQILNKQKTIETRTSPSLHPYVGKKVGIIRTGVGPATLVGYTTIGEPKFYKNEKEFDKDYDKHLVTKKSPFYITEKGKWGYPLHNVKKIPESIIKSKGIVARTIN
jgi:hypothetical protein